jgi:murein DD-endopeptidase MepM/ murein hydrolase activator NlpD
VAPIRCLVLPLLLGLFPAAAANPTAMPGSAPLARATAGGRPAGTWAWPVVGPVIRDFDPPTDPYGSGHRGIDIAASLGTPILAPEAGTVSFAGKVGGELFITLDHGGGLQSTYSWVSATFVHKGDVVARGAQIGLSGRGHPGSVVPHLHFGVKLNGVYVDPLNSLAPAPIASLIHLAPDLAAP